MIGPLWHIRLVFAEGIPDVTDTVRAQAQEQESARHRELLNSLVTASVDKTDGQVCMRTIDIIALGDFGFRLSATCRGVCFAVGTR